MASKLPFVVQPKLEPVIEVIGTDASGRIEVERRGYLTVAEKAFMQAANGSGAMGKIYVLAGKIASKTGKKPQEVFEDMSEGTGAEYLDPYREEISELLFEVTEFQEKARVYASCALLMHRVSPEITVEDVLELHPDLLDALYEIYQEEDAKDTSRLDTIKEDNEEDEPAGKSSKAK